ncbi:MAG: sigma-70 family RNA polymerase sigma factor [Bacteroidales bacterium]|nr:sigma-70 family RNA polymerase sigma factor [Bacteroidales bacterium]
MQNEKELIKKCLKRDERAMEELYKFFSPKLFGICLRYTKNRMEAEDLLHDGFIRILNNLENYRHEGSFQGWVCKIMVTSAINYYHKNLARNHDADLEDVVNEELMEDDISSFISHNELLEMIRKLPDGYRMVFNMFAIEGYSHKEIGDMLGVSENTSKTQLLKARKALQNMIFTEKKMTYEKSA